MNNILKTVHAFVRRYDMEEIYVDSIFSSLRENSRPSGRRESIKVFDYFETFDE